MTSPTKICLAKNPKIALGSVTHPLPLAVVIHQSVTKASYKKILSFEIRKPKKKDLEKSRFLLTVSTRITKVH